MLCEQFDSQYDKNSKTFSQVVANKAAQGESLDDSACSIVTSIDDPSNRERPTVAGQSHPQSISDNTR